jgi:hypothetical protein
MTTDATRRGGVPTLPRYDGGGVARSYSQNILKHYTHDGDVYRSFFFFFFS